MQHLLQQALQLSIEAEPLEKKLRVDGVRTGRIRAVDPRAQFDEAVTIGLLTDTEAALLRRYDELVMSIVNVDDFAPTELGTHAGAPSCT